jgi:hypothetical protein
LFCSLGDWASNITDILRESKYDYLDLDDERESKVLFRYYTRFLLVCSEMLTDFQDIYIQSENLKPGRQSNVLARQFYSSLFNKDFYTEIFNFINCVCKHKTQHIHLCNNHLEIIFEDSGEVPDHLNYVRMGDVDTGHDKNAVLMSPLYYFINALNGSYVMLDEYFAVNPKKFQDLCYRYKSVTSCA